MTASAWRASNTLASLGAAVVVACAGACTGGAAFAGTGAVPGTSSSGTARQQLGELLATVPVMQFLPDVPGYDRECGPHHGCVFGPAWSDDTSAAGGHDGCETRNQAISQQADQVVRRGPCKVVAGTLHDPYTGAQVPFTAATVNLVEGDHLLPLKRAWDLGAATWTPQRRAAFANDLNLEVIITAAAQNKSKGDKSISQWQPPDPAYRCTYATRYLAVTSAYQLPLTQQDRDVLAALLPTCPSEQPTHTPAAQRPAPDSITPPTLTPGKATR